MANNFSCKLTLYMTLHGQTLSKHLYRSCDEIAIYLIRISVNMLLFIILCCLPWLLIKKKCEKYKIAPFLHIENVATIATNFGKCGAK